MSKILVTGGNGLVGSQFIGDDYIKFGSKEYNLIDPVFANLMLRINKPKSVIHCAGKVGGVGGNMNHKGEFFYQNIMMNTNVIEECRKNNVEDLVVFCQLVYSQMM